MIINRVGGAGKSGGIIAKQVAAGADDGWWDTSSSSFASDDTAPLYGYYGYYNIFARWTGITIPGKPTILSSSIQAYIANSLARAVTVRIYFNDAATPTAPTTYATATGKTKTTAYVDWTIPATAGWQTSPDISPVIQELVDSYGPFSNGAMMVLLNPSVGDEDINDMRAYEYSGNTHGMKLNITW